MRNGLILIAAATMGLSACDTSQIGKDFMREAGSSLDRGEFGNSSLYNQLVHTGELNAAINLTRKFAAEAPNTINFDFDQSNLDAEARASLDDVAYALGTCLMAEQTRPTALLGPTAIAVHHDRHMLRAVLRVSRHGMRPLC